MSTDTLNSGESQPHPHIRTRPYPFKEFDARRILAVLSYTLYCMYIVLRLGFCLDPFLYRAKKKLWMQMWVRVELSGPRAPVTQG